MRCISGDFQGGNYPIGTEVSFFTNIGLKKGKVESLLLHAARVQTPNQDVWKVPYKFLRLEQEARHEADLSLPDIESLGKDLLREHGLNDWKFGFDLSKSRAGVCNYGPKVITLSVTFCLKATEEQIRDVILHEIAHALAGFKAAHGPKWKKIATSIGCSGSRCHYVSHTKPTWVGACGCFSGNEKTPYWTRHRLSNRTRNAVCSRCHTKIKWKRRKI